MTETNHNLLLKVGVGLVVTGLGLIAVILGILVVTEILVEFINVATDIIILLTPYETRDGAMLLAIASLFWFGILAYTIPTIGEITLDKIESLRGDLDE